MRKYFVTFHTDAGAKYVYPVASWNGAFKAVVLAVLAHERDHPKEPIFDAEVEDTGVPPLTDMGYDVEGYFLVDREEW